MSTDVFRQTTLGYGQYPAEVQQSQEYFQGREGEPREPRHLDTPSQLHLPSDVRRAATPDHVPCAPHPRHQKVAPDHGVCASHPRHHEVAAAGPAQRPMGMTVHRRVTSLPPVAVETNTEPPCLRHERASLEANNFMIVARVSTNMDLHVFSIVHLSCESLLLTVAAPKSAGQKLGAVKFKLERNIKSPFSVQWTDAVLQHLQTHLATQCAQLSSPPSLLELARMWLGVVRNPR